MYAIRLVAESGGKVLCRYEPGRNSQDLWLDEPFELRDIKSLGTPKILFKTGFESATGT
jgi:hypothetical protein